MLHSPRLAIDGIGGGQVVPAVASIADPFLVPCGLAWSGRMYFGSTSFISFSKSLLIAKAYLFDDVLGPAPIIYSFVCRK